MELYENSNDEIEYISYLRNSNLEAFDEVCDSQLWKQVKEYHRIIWYRSWL